MATNSKKKTTAKKTSTKKTREVQKEVETPKKKVRTASRGKDIVMILIVGLAGLILVSFFTDALNWLKQGTYFVFGLLTYIFPVLLVIISWRLMYHDKETSTAIRLVGLFLLVFAVSGILDKINQKAEFGWSLGGLLGKADRFIFNKAIGDAGSYVVDGILILISAVLLTNFSLFSFLGERTDPSSEVNQEKRRRRQEELELKELERQAHEMELANRELERKSQVAYDLEDLRNENLMRREAIYKQQTYEEKLAQRQIPIRGIGDTTIRDTSDNGTEETFIATEGKNLFHPENFESENHSFVVDEEEDTKDIPMSGAIFNMPDDDETYVGKDDYKSTVVTGKTSITNIGTDLESAKNFKTSTSSISTTSDDDFEYIKPKKSEKPAKPYRIPPLRLLKKGGSIGASKGEIQADLQEKAHKLKETLEVFGINATITNIACGPSVTRFEIQPELGVRVNAIVNLTNDIKLSLGAADIRMEAPIPGKSAIGIEIPNKVKQAVVLRDLLESEQYKNAKSKISFVLGRDIEGNAIIPDLGKMPHLLIAGTTGSGKSVCINSMITSLLYHASPEELKIIMIDPKVVELSAYNGIPHLLFPVVTNPKKAAMALAFSVNEMDRRYELFATNHVNNIESYNEFIDNHPVDDDGVPREKMAKWVVIIDELADLMMTSPKEVEDYICRLAQKARAAGIHLVIATQSPRVNVLTGLIKANVPSRIALTVASQMDSRVIIDIGGAEKLVGNGDMLFAPAGMSKPIRVQGTFISEDEVNDVVEFIKSQGNVIGGMQEAELPNIEVATSQAVSQESGSDFDEQFADCGRLIIESQKASISMLQRRFKLGFNRAARIMDQLCENGVVGEEQGTKPRDILMTMEEFESFLSNN